MIMEELSIEKKAKRYDEALEKAKILLKTIGNATLGNLVLKNEFENMFPSLSLSEDEKDKCMLNNIIDTLRPLSETTHSGYAINSMIAWLEKQGEEIIPLEQIILNVWELGMYWKELTKGFCNTEYGTQLDYIVKHWKEGEHYIKSLKKQGEQKPVDKVEPKFKEGDTIRLKNGDGRLWKIEKIREDGYTMIGHGLDETDFLFLDDKWEVVEPYQESNPTAPAPVRDNYDEIKQAETSPTLSNSSNIRKNAWSEEDEKIKCSLVYLIEEIIRQPLKRREDWKGYIDWLKSLKDRVQPQPQQKWSDEDKEMRIKVLKYLSTRCNVFEYEEVECWLNSLRPQNRWKPSDEQMKALKGALYDAIWQYDFKGSPIKEEVTRRHAETIESLYNDLKKLREEDV